METLDEFIKDIVIQTVEDVIPETKPILTVLTPIIEEVVKPCLEEVVEDVVKPCLDDLTTELINVKNKVSATVIIEEIHNKTEDILQEFENNNKKVKNNKSAIVDKIMSIVPLYSALRRKSLQEDTSLSSPRNSLSIAKDVIKEIIKEVSDIESDILKHRRTLRRNLNS